MIRVLITSNEHPNYNQTGRVVHDWGPEGVDVELSGGEVVRVPEKQWKVTSLQDMPTRKSV